MLQLLFLNDLTFTEEQNHRSGAELIAFHISASLTSKMSVKKNKPMLSLRNLNFDSTTGHPGTGA